MPRRRRLVLQVDDRTETMTVEALECRGYNHFWQRRIIPPNRVLEMARSGYAETVRTCVCGTIWTQVYDLATFETVTDRREYPKDGYLLAKGGGRLPKAYAKKALFAREHPALTV